MTLAQIHPSKDGIPSMPLSVLGYQIRPLSVPEESVQQYMRQHQLSLPLAQLLAARKIPLEKVPLFLNPRLRDTLPDPLHLLDMAKAADRLARAIMANEPLVIFGDYDVDGATSSSLLYRFVTTAGGAARIYIPDRIKEGYGPNAATFLRLQREGYRLLITVDCGAVAFEPIKQATDAGMDIIVVDHHQGAEALPEAYAVVNPNRADETTPHKNLAAVGVAFLLMVATHRLLKERGHYANREAPDLMQWLDIVALGTVCDVMPLTGLNRAFVHQGLRVLGSRHNPGLRALSDLAGIQGTPSPYHLGFILGPRINAGGRIGQADLGAQLLTTDDSINAESLARQLHALNDERRAIEAQMVEDAIREVETTMMEDPCLILVKPHWHQGVVGIVASRMKDKFDKPSIVITVENGMGKASGRSVTGVDLGAAVAAAREQGLLVNGGGHAMAAGFTVKEALIPQVREFLNGMLRGGISNYHITRERVPELSVPVSAITLQLTDELDQLEPFGTGNPQPLIHLPKVRVVEVRAMHEKHLICMLADDSAVQRGSLLRATAYNAMPGDMASALTARVGKTVDVIGTLGTHYYRGQKRLHFTLVDVVV